MSIHPEQLKFNEHITYGEAGFTLVETLVALVILTTGLIPVLYFATSAVNAGTSIRDDLIAANLAQEGIEVIRAIRDSNWIKNDVFDANLANGAYTVEWNSTVPTLLSGPLDGDPLNLNNGLYTYSGGTPTKFKRTITITKINAGELKVIDTVTWNEQGSRTKSINVEEHLFDWR